MPALPEIYLTAAICVLLLADVFFGEKRRGLAPTLTLLILAGGAFVTAVFRQRRRARAAVRRQLRGRCARRVAQAIRVPDHGAWRCCIRASISSAAA